MRHMINLGAGLFLPLLGQAQLVTSPALPATLKRPVSETYFGQVVVDNFRWLEDIKSPQTQQWYQAQADYTNAVMSQIPGREKLLATFIEYDQVVAARYSEIKKRGDQWFYRKTLPSEKVGKIYSRLGKAGTEQLLFNPFAFDSAKAYAIAAFAPSPDGKKLVIGLVEGGGEYATLRTLDVATKQISPESIPAVFGGEMSWLPDSQGFLYTPDNSADPNDPKAVIDTKARFHRLGSAPQTDPELFSRAKYTSLGIQPAQFPQLTISDDGTQLYGWLRSGDWRVDAWVARPAELTNSSINWKRLVAPTDSVRAFCKLGNHLFLHSVKGAPYGQILVTDATNPDPARAITLLAEETKVITGMVSTKDYLLVTLSDGINETVRQYDPQRQQWATLQLPVSGSMQLTRLDASASNEVIATVTSWNNPGARYDYNPENKESAISAFHVPTPLPGLNELMVEELEIPGHDGTRVPLSLIYRKGLRKDGTNICLMTGYGAFGLNAYPYFNRLTLALLNLGVVVAEPHVRGGGEKGQGWHQAGFKTTKANSWNDFIASGEYLIKTGYTRPGKLIGMGTSAGGILIGRAITQRPDLFAAAISNVSLSNPMRYETASNGPAMVAEFGTVKDSVECRALYAMDAYLHVKEGSRYPAVICVGGMNDPRVPVWQPGKMAAALQTASNSGKPVLLQVNYDNGHKTEDKAVTFRNFATMYAFALWQAGHPEFQPNRELREKK